MAHSIVERAAVGHRVARVDGEIDDRRLELREIGDDRQRVRIDVMAIVIFPAEPALEEPHRLGEAVPNGDPLGLQRLARAKASSCRHQLGAAIGCLERVLDERLDAGSCARRSRRGCR